MKKSVYVESSVISYLTFRPSNDLIKSARQAITDNWWNFKHINNADKKSKINQVLEELGYIPPILCSPEELGGSHD